MFPENFFLPDMFDYLAKLLYGRVFEIRQKVLVKEQESLQDNDNHMNLAGETDSHVRVLCSYSYPVPAYAVDFIHRW